MNYFFRVRIILYNQQVKDDRLKKYSFDFPEDFIEPIKHEITNLWDMVKDGKGWFGELKKKDEEYYKKLMRK